MLGLHGQAQAYGTEGVAGAYLVLGLLELPEMPVKLARPFADRFSVVCLLQDVELAPHVDVRKVQSRLPFLPWHWRYLGRLLRRRETG